MRRAIVAVVATLAAVAGGAVAAPARAAGPPPGSFTHKTLPAAKDGSYPARDYWLYVPARLAPERNRAVVTFLHGCTQSGDDAAKGVGWNQLADRVGFVVAYPEQHVTAAGEVDGSAAQCWNWGQVAYPRGQGELESVAQITRTVGRAHHATAGGSYLIGLSAGAIMANAMAATYPDVYTAFGSVAGCSYLCADPTGDAAYLRMGAAARVMPTFVVTGTADYLTNPAMGELTVTQWLGTDDLADDGMHNQSISLSPTSTEHRNLDSLDHADPAKGDACAKEFPRNPCPLGALGVAPYPATVRKYADGEGRTVVEAWLVHGLSHNYSGGSYGGSFTDPYGPDVTGAAWAFFSSHSPRR